ncbi:MAG: NAD(P)-binding protein [Blautia sp.]|nr:NAD(P)-binding protein [Blautia sp.]
MIRISQLKLPVDHDQKDLEKKIRKVLHSNQIPFTYEILRQSLDARRKNEKYFVYTIDVSIPEETKRMKQIHDKNVMLIDRQDYSFPEHGSDPLPSQPVIVGSGPAGLFCAWYLAREGYHPLILERGESVDNRLDTVQRFWETGELKENSNVQFGEGGAGTFSDGKLNTLVKDVSGRNREVLKRFIMAGAPEEILYQQKPHLGTDALVHIVKNLRQQIQTMGGTFCFDTRLTDIVIQNNRIIGVKTDHAEHIPVEICVLAVGHSARDTFEMLYRHNIPMEKKAFAVGLRVEHPQSMINEALYGEEDPVLGPASYKLTHTCKNGRGVYTFCMCPGGYVVNASSEMEALAVNGMSYQRRDSANANSAVIVTVTPEDFPEAHVLGGVAFQRELEKAAYRLNKGKIPVQLFEDFCRHKVSDHFGEVKPCIKGDYAFGNLREILPKEAGDSIEEGMQAFGKKIPGFDRPDCVFSGVETRTSSPVRILRDTVSLESSIRGIYPCGEGAGYAGGITSAAMDGIRVAEAIVKKYRNF